jgi:hypothetical protein
MAAIRLIGAVFVILAFNFILWTLLYPLTSHL